METVWKKMFRGIVAGIVLMAALWMDSSRAATITWSPATTISAVTDVSTNGTFVYGYDWANSTQTVNGVTFTGTNSNTSGGTNVTLTGFQNNSTSAFSSGANPFNSLAAAYKSMLIGGDYTNSGTTATVTLNGLISGRDYQVQFWINDPRPISGRNETITSAGGNTITLTYSASNSAGSPGQFTIGSFTADASTQSFTLLSNQSTQITAMQLRLLAPASAPIYWGKPTPISGDADISQIGTSVYAYNWNGTDQTVNGGTFVGSFSATGGGSDVVVAGTGVTLGAGGQFGSQSAPYSNLSGSYQIVLGGALYTPAATPVVVTLKNLTPGQIYAVQFWVQDAQPGVQNLSEVLTSPNGNSVSLNFTNQAADGGLGQYVIGTFLAASATQQFTVTGNASSTQINALQVRLLTSLTWTGGSGLNWDTSTIGNWVTTGTATSAIYATGSAVIFDSTGGANVFAGSGVSDSFVFINNVDTPAYVINGSIGGLSSVLKQASGSVTLAGANTYTGPTIVTGGSLALGNGGSLGATAVSVGNGCTFKCIPAFVSSPNSIGGSLSLNAGSAFSMADNVTNVLNISGTLSIGAATGTPPTLAFELGDGTSAFDTVAAAGAASLGASGATISISYIGNSAPIPGSYTLISGGAGSALNGGPLSLSASKIAFGSAFYPIAIASTPTSVTLTVFPGSPASLYWTGFAGPAWNAVTGAPSTNWATTLAGTIDAQAQPGRATDVFFTSTNSPLNLTNTLGQDTSINSLNFTAGSGTVTIGAGNTLTLTNGTSTGITVASGSAAQTINANINLDSEYSSIQNWTNSSSNPLSVGGGIGGTGGIKYSGGTIVLAGTNTFSGGVTLSSGQININSNTALGSGAFVISGGTIDNTSGVNHILVNNNTQSWNGDFTFSGSNDLNLGGGAVTMSASRTITANGTHTLTAGGTVSGAGLDLNKQGSGTLFLSGSGTNTYLNTNVSGGTLTTNGTNITTGRITINGGGILNFGPGSVQTMSNDQLTCGNSGQVGTVNVAGTLNLTTNSHLIGQEGSATGTLHILSGGIINLSSGAQLRIANTSFNNPIGTMTLDPGSALNLSSGSVFVLSNTSGSGTPNATFNFNGGTIFAASGIASGNSVQTATVTFNFNGGTLKSGFASTTFFNIASGTKTVNVRNGGAIIDTNGFDDTIVNPLQHSNVSGDATVDGGLIKNSNGILTLNGASTFTGPTAINGGTIKINSNNGLPAVTSVSVGSNATLNVNGFNQTIASLADIGNATGSQVLLGSGALTIAGPATTTFSGSIGGTGALTKSGTGALFLNGASSYSGATTVSAGDLRGIGSLLGSTVFVTQATASVWPGLGSFATSVPSSGEALTVGGLDLSLGGEMKIALNTSSAASTQSVSVLGLTCNISGGTLSLGIPQGAVSANVYTILQAVNGFSGTFANILVNGVNDNAGSIVTVGYSANAVTVQIVGSVTPVTLDNFTARADGAGVLLSWDAVSEFMNAGFHLYRRSIAGGGWQRADASLINGRITSPDFKKYQYLDWAPAGVYTYKLESVGIAGIREAYTDLAGPVVVNGDTFLATEDGLDAALQSLAAMAKVQRSTEIALTYNSAQDKVSPVGRVSGEENTTWNTSNNAIALGFGDAFALPAASVRELAQSDSAKSPAISSAATGALPLQAAVRMFSAITPPASANYNAAKVTYSAAGVMLINQADLPSGFDINHISVQREGRALTPLALTPSGLIVYGAGYNDDYTDKDALMLRAASGSTIAGSQSNTSGLFASPLPVNVTSPATTEVDYHDVYFDYSFRPYSFPPWFSSQYLTEGTTQSFVLNTPGASAGAAQFTLNLWSLSSSAAEPHHALLVSVNGTPVGQAIWSGDGKMMQLAIQVPSNVLINGANTVDLTTPSLDASASQICFLHSMIMNYTRYLDGSAPVQAVNNSAAAQLFEVGNIAASGAWVVDTRFPDRAVLAATETQPQTDGTLKVRFVAGAGGTGTYLVVPFGQENRPLSIASRQVKVLKLAGTYMATGPSQFSSGVQPLLMLHTKEGIRGTFVDQEQLFDYYNYGRYGPAGIQNAVRSTRPKYLLLLGRTTYDYKNYSGLNVDPMCPTFLVSTSFWAQSTSDSLFGDLGRGYPEVAVGRLPVNNVTELSGAVNHILNYTGMPSSGSGVRIHAVADLPDADAGDFASKLESIRVNHPEVGWQQNYLGQTYMTAPEVTAAMTQAANGGADAILYAGHGNASRLGKFAPRILDTDLVQQWTGNTVFLQATCAANWMAANQTGYKGIAIQALTQPQGGISANIATSTYMTADAATAFMDQLLKNAQSGTGMRWGDALVRAQQWALSQSSGSGFYGDLGRTEQLFGDPAMRVFAPTSKTPNAPNGAGGSSTTPILPATGTF